MEIRLPASKSISARALIINALAEQPCELRNLSDCDDTQALLHVLHGGSDIGAAGTAMRFATALLAATPGVERTLTGSPRMKERPIGILVDALRQLGADVEYTEREGYPPLHIRGKQLTTEHLSQIADGTPVLSLPANISSQYISALLMIAPTLKQGLTICLEGTIASRPYIEMTCKLMAEWDIHAEWQTTHTLYIPAHAYARTPPYEVEADWSAASYFLAARRDVHLPGLQSPSVQGDNVVVKMLQQLDTLQGTTEVLQLDFAQCPDLAQTLVVAACMAGRPFCYTGLQSLRIKETDRIAALVNECAKLGWTLTEPTPGSLSWHGGEEPLPPTAAPTLATYKDHRMAMAFALCMLRWPHLKFDDPSVVTKSFPNFWQEFRKLL